MQSAQNQLREIVWEIIGKCNNKCDYCGSKEVWDTEIDEEKIIKIAKEISKYPPEQIDTSGGDPLLVSLKTHQEIVKILTGAGIQCKIIVNPKSVKKEEHIKILDLYSYVGMSINTKEEFSAFDRIEVKSVLSKKIVIITNFNLKNIFLFNKLQEFVKFNNYSWQIQYSVFPEGQDDLAIYNEEGAVEDFREKLQNALNEGLKISICDNINDGPCWAARHTCGITYDGFVIPCLSMRSWYKNLFGEDILVSGLQKIWEGNFFDNYRFKEFECCKDICRKGRLSISQIKKEELSDYEDIEKWQKKEPPISMKYGLRPVEPKGIQMYAVSPIVTAYAVTPYDAQGTFVYAVKPYNEIPCQPKDFIVAYYMVQTVTENPTSCTTWSITTTNSIEPNKDKKDDEEKK